MKVKSNKGFTGVDIAVSIVILIIFVSLITTMFYNLTVTSKKIERKTTATNLAIQTIEAMKIIDFDELTETMTIEEINNLVENEIKIPNGYEIEVKVDNTTYPDVIKIISAQVNYKSGKNNEKVKIETLVKNYSNTIVTVGDATVESIKYEKNGTGYRITLNNIQYVNKYSVQYKEASESEYKTIGTELTSTNYSFDVDKYGLYYIKVKDNSTNVAKRSEIVVSVYANQTFNTETTKITMVKEITDTGIKTAEVAIPKGFTISGVDNECAQTIVGTTIEKRYTIDDGVVIYMLNGATVNWGDATSVDTAQKTYDQFVWVPVNNPVLDLSGNSAVLSSDANIKAAIQTEINGKRYPIAIKKSNGDYFGVLYEFSLDNTTNTMKIEPDTNWTPVSKSQRREPDAITSYDVSSYLSIINTILGTTYSNTTAFETALQTQYNEMVEKVIINKGFWVGRYETSNMINSNSTTQRVKVIRGTTTGIASVSWYRMYAQQRNYIKLANIQGQLVSSMIWGSQWDQIMIWMKNVRNESQSSYYIINAIGMGNYGTISGVNDGWSEMSLPAPTGYQDIYKVKNIYDLAGNLDDWNLEASTSEYRGSRRSRLRR